MRWLPLLAFTLLQLRSAECRVACLNGGWDDGDYVPRPPTCRCVDYTSYEGMVHQKRLLAPKKKSAKEKPVAVDTSRPWWTY